MPVPRAVAGFDHALVETLVVTPEPATEPVAPVKRDFGVSGKHHDQGRYAVWHWSHLESEAEYLDLLGQLYLNENDTAELTIYTKNERLIWTLYNAIAHFPESGSDMKWENMFPRGVAVYFTDLREIEV